MMTEENGAALRAVASRILFHVDPGSPLVEALKSQYHAHLEHEIKRPGGQGLFRMRPAEFDQTGVSPYMVATRGSDGELLFVAGLLVHDRGSHCLFKSVIVASAFRSLGISTMLARHAQFCERSKTPQKEQWAYVRIYPSDRINMASLSAFQKAGFHVEGIEKRRIRSSFADAHLKRTAEADRQSIRTIKLRAAARSEPVRS